MALRLPDWMLYGAALAAVTWVSVHWRETADAPPAPPPMDAEEGVLVGPSTPFDHTLVVDSGSGPPQPSAGTAFAVSAAGQWLTARHVLEGCHKAAVLVGAGQGLAAKVVAAPKADVALLLTQGGPVALPLGVDRPLHVGQRGFHPGFPQGRPGEVATRLLGRETLRIKGRGARREPVLAWAEVGRTANLDSALSGLSGAPVLDSKGRVVGVTLAEAPRRGRIYTTAPESVAAALPGPAREHELAVGEPITTDNYGRASDGLRRDLRVAQVMCLS